MKRWAWVVAALYVAVLLVLTVPAILLAFIPKIGVGNAIAVFAWWPYWLWLLFMFASQFALLAVPVRVASLRPITRGAIWRTILAGGLMAGGLAAGAILSVYEFFMRDKTGDWPGWTAPGVGIATCASGRWSSSGWAARMSHPASFRVSAGACSGAVCSNCWSPCQPTSWPVAGIIVAPDFSRSSA